MTLLDQISDALGASGALGDLSNTLGASASETDSLIGAGLPAILGGLGAQASGDGASALFNMLGNSGGFADSLGAFFGAGDSTGLASKLVGSLFGSQRGAIESHVAQQSGGAMSLVSRFLPMLAPAVLGMLGKIVGDDDALDADGLSTQLAAFGADGDLGDILSNTSDDDRAGFVDGLASFGDAGGLAALIPAASAAAPAKAAAAVAGGGSVAALASGVTGGDADDDFERTGLGWMSPVLLLAIGLIAGLILWQCTGSGDDDHGDREDQSEEVAAEPEPTVAPTEAPEPTAVPEPTATAVPEPTATAVPEPTATPEPAPVVTIADLAVGTPDLSTLTAIATDLDLVGVLSDPAAGPFTVFAPTNDAFAGAEGVLSRLDSDQTRQAVTFHVVEGVYTAADLADGAELTTLAGETLVIGENVTLPGGVGVVSADITADNGIVHVVDNVLVPGSIQRSLAADDVNQLFVLEPIQFATSSADILPESVPTLDQAIATLTSLPAGTRYEVQGHTDSDGSDEFNQTLSEQRAASVVAYLVAGGVDPEVLEPRGYGETSLKVDPEVTPEDFAANRRIEFVDITG